MGSALPRYSNTTGSPSSKSADAMSTLTKLIDRKGWRSPSVTRSRKPQLHSSKVTVEERVAGLVFVGLARLQPGPYRGS